MKTDTTKPKMAKPKIKPKKAKPYIVRDFASVKHIYSRDEREQITSKLTNAVQTSAELDAQAKAVSKDFKAKIDTAKSIVTEATNKLTNGYEMQQVEVEVHMDRKKGNKKLLVYAPGKPDHRKFIRDEKMTEGDYQRLPIEVAPVPPEDKKKKNAAFTEEDIVKVVAVIVAEQKASVSLIQRRLRLGYAQAAAIMDELEKRGAVGPSKGSEPRDIIDLEKAAKKVEAKVEDKKSDKANADDNEKPPGEPAV